MRTLNLKKIAVMAVLLSTPALAGGIDGAGFITIGGGGRWLPNWWLRSKAAEAGTPVSANTIDLGAQGTVAFGYGVSSWLAVTINIVAGYQGFSLDLPDGQRKDLSTVIGGGLLGGRAVFSNAFAQGVTPYLEVGAGPMLATLNGAGAVTEATQLGLSGAGGVMFQFTRQYGMALEARYLQTRMYLPNVSSFNAGGVFFTAQFTITFPPSLGSHSELPAF